MIKTVDEVYEEIDTLIVQGKSGIAGVLRAWAESIVDECYESAEVTFVYDIDKESIMKVKQQIK